MVAFAGEANNKSPRIQTRTEDRANRDIVESSVLRTSEEKNLIREYALKSRLKTLMIYQFHGGSWRHERNALLSGINLGREPRSC